MPVSPEKITILLAEDQPTARAGIRAVLSQEPDFEVVGEAEDGEKIVSMVADLRPKILLLDLVMPNLSPARLEKRIRENYPDTVTLVLTGHDRDAYLAGMIDAGVAGYLSKNEAIERLVKAIRLAAGGSQIFSNEQIARAIRWKRQVKNKWESLTDRERQVLQLLGNGKDNNLIAQELSVSSKTIEAHLTEIYRKLEVNNRVEAVLWWEKHSRDFAE